MRIATLLPGLAGRGVLLAAPTDVEQVRQALVAGGYAVAEVPAEAGMRAAQAAIARALRLPETAGRNLDAMADALRDLATWWPDDEQVALLWPGAEQLVEGDLPGFLTLTGILRGATDDLGRAAGTSGGREFETVAFVARHGVRALGETSR